jgi:hypothetical protein
MEGFGSTIDVLFWHERPEEAGGAFRERKVTFGMFTWAVRCGIIGERDLLSQLGSIGSVLLQLVGLCHGDGLVDADLEEFVRWVVDEGWVCGSSVYVVKWVVCIVCPLTVSCLKLFSGGGLSGGLLAIGAGAVVTLISAGSGGRFDVDSLFVNPQVNLGPFWCWATLDLCAAFLGG